MRPLVLTVILWLGVAPRTARADADDDGLRPRSASFDERHAMLAPRRERGSVSESPFIERPTFIGLSLGGEGVAGLRVGVSLLPEIAVELSGGVLPLGATAWGVDYASVGMDLRIRLNARTAAFVPTARVGLTYEAQHYRGQSTTDSYLLPAIALGAEWRANAGLTLGVDVGEAAEIDLDAHKPQGPYRTLTLYVGYAL